MQISVLVILNYTDIAHGWHYKMYLLVILLFATFISKVTLLLKKCLEKPKAI